MVPGYCRGRKGPAKVVDFEGDAKGAERTAEGLVRELLPSALVRVGLDGGHQVIAHFPGSGHANFTRLRVGDRVRVALSVQDRTRGRVLELLTKGRMP